MSCKSTYDVVFDILEEEIYAKDRWDLREMTPEELVEWLTRTQEVLEDYDQEFLLPYVQKYIKDDQEIDDIIDAAFKMVIPSALR